MVDGVWCMVDGGVEVVWCGVGWCMVDGGACKVVYGGWRCMMVYGCFIYGDEVVYKV